MEWPGQKRHTDATGASDSTQADEQNLPAQIAFLTVARVNALNEEAVRRYPPTESLAVRDARLLASAVMSPRHTWGGAYLYLSRPEMAAGYLISLNQNHAFENGNKRVACAACSTFLPMNGFRPTLSQERALDLTRSIASHKLEREQVVAILESAIETL